MRVARDLLFDDLALFNDRFLDRLTPCVSVRPHHSLGQESQLEYIANFSNNHFECRMYWPTQAIDLGQDIR